MKFLKRMLTNENGAAMTEYALLIALIAIGVIIALGFLRDELNAVFDYITGELGGTHP